MNTDDSYDVEDAESLIFQCENGLLPEVIMMFYKDLASARKHPLLKESPLYIACKNGQFEVVKALLLLVDIYEPDLVFDIDE